TKIVYYEEQPIGYYGYYEGYPNKETVWIAIFVIDQKYRKQSHGKNLYLQVQESMKAGGYKNIAIAVHSKNINGLKFWVNLGFTEIIKVRLEKEYAVLGLNKLI
ncbi:MAG: GNAT family N-acetyltransferase, partial [Candidatus Izemoplasmatales bacterium]